jgi:glutamate synthase (NADPH/NADH)
MTGGRIVVLGTTGRNFAAGMSGGIAYVLDYAKDFRSKVNMEMVELDTVNDPHEIAELRSMIEDHQHWTGSERAERILKNFNQILPRFVRVMPTDYKRVLEAEAAQALADKKAKHQTIDIPGSSNNVHAHADKKSEPSLVDLEDSAVDESAAKKRVQTLDKVRGFMKYKRLAESYRNPRKRVKDWAEISSRLSEDDCKVQAARCMDCGVPFCQVRPSSLPPPVATSPY